MIDMNKIDLLLAKMRSAGETIKKLKEQNDAGTMEINRLNDKIHQLETENKALKSSFNDKELLHKNLETKIMSLLDILPDLDFEESDVVQKEVPIQAESKSSESVFFSPELEAEVALEPTVTSITFAEASFANEDVIEEDIDPESDSSEEASFEIFDNEPTTSEIDETLTPTLITEDTTLFANNSTDSLPIFDEKEPDFANMFAYDDIIDNELSGVDKERVDDIKDLPKGVL